MKIYDPTGVSVKSKTQDATVAKRSLAGKCVGILSNLWPSYEHMVGVFRRQLTDVHKAAQINYYEIPRTRAAPAELLDRVAAECDVAIVGLGN